MYNAIAYRCVAMIAQAAASVPWMLLEDEKEITSHALLHLLAQPNRHQAGNTFTENWISHLQISGNAWIEAIELDGRVRELHILRPDLMRIISDAKGQPAACEYRAGEHKVRFPCSAAMEENPLLHMRFFHPLNDFYGLSPMEAAALAVDTHNAAGRWARALLNNSARPSGALVYKNPDGTPNLTPEQFDRLRNELAENYEGAANAGRPLLLEGGLEWTAIGHSPKDMDFISTKHIAAREIALAFGVPPMLLGIPGDNTYSNYAEANRNFWRQTILPLAAKAANAFSGWLAPRFGENLRLVPNLEQIPALASEREILWKRVESASFLTINEKRAAIGYPPIENGDALPAKSTS